VHRHSGSKQHRRPTLIGQHELAGGKSGSERIPPSNNSMHGGRRPTDQTSYNPSPNPASHHKESLPPQHQPHSSKTKGHNDEVEERRPQSRKPVAMTEGPQSAAEPEARARWRQQYPNPMAAAGGRWWWRR
jgi:hypothetical protein